jgi:hypothetical protein
MWKLPIDPSTKNKMIDFLILPISCLRRSTNNITYSSKNIYTLPYKRRQVKLMHHSFSNPPIQTINEATNNNQLQRKSCLNSSKMVNKDLDPPPVTSKERLKKY